MRSKRSRPHLQCLRVKLDRAAAFASKARGRCDLDREGPAFHRGVLRYHLHDAEVAVGQVGVAVETKKRSGRKRFAKNTVQGNSSPRVSAYSKYSCQQTSHYLLKRTFFRQRDQ